MSQSDSQTSYDITCGQCAVLLFMSIPAMCKMDMHLSDPQVCRCSMCFTVASSKAFERPI